MEIYLIRHTAPSIPEGLIYGRSEVPLQQTFEAEAALIKQQLPVQLDSVYSSPSERCTRLAALIAPDYLREKALQELDFGKWEGKKWADIDRGRSEWWMQDFVHRSPPGGETMFEMNLRVMHFLEELMNTQASQVALVTHAGVIRIIRSRLQQIELRDAFHIPVRMGEVFKFSYEAQDDRNDLFLRY